MACGRLAELALPNATITLATEVAAGAFTMASPPAFGPPPDFAGLPAFCRVAATLTPSPDSTIKMEVWMPVDWNGKFAGTGNGGAAGEIFYWEMAPVLAKGYAVANSDTGHEGGGADWTFAVGHPEKLVDSGHRAVHEMTVQAKAIVGAYYGMPARLSYWSGCSMGGRQGLMEALRYPDDYDAIAARAPAMSWSPLMTHGLTIQRALTDPQGPLPAAKLRQLRAAALAACDVHDGVADDVIADPPTCTFDPGALACSGADAPTCLTPREVEHARTIYRGTVNPRTGEQIFPGPAPGSELEWGAYTPGVFPISVNFLRDVVFADPSWDPFSFDFDADFTRLREASDHLFDASSPDLSAFVASGGKLVLWHGWNDGLIPARSTVAYYEKVVESLGADTAANHVRLFLAPGVNHCAGGEGAADFDHIAALEQWIERSTAPEVLIASRTLEGGGTRTRPLCPHPRVARYRGTGSTDDAASFECVTPE
jgi:feruloyl esterase